MSKDKDKEKGRLQHIEIFDDVIILSETRLIDESEVPEDIRNGKATVTPELLQKAHEAYRQIMQEEQQARHQRLVARRAHIKRIK